MSLVAAIAIRQPSRSPVWYSRCSQRIEPSRRELGQRRMGVGRDERHVGVAGQQPLDLLQPDVAAADDQAAPALEPQAGDVERRLEHVPHAGLVADPLAELADAFLAEVGLGGHASKRSRARLAGRELRVMEVASA